MIKMHYMGNIFKHKKSKSSLSPLRFALCTVLFRSSCSQKPRLREQATLGFSNLDSRVGRVSDVMSPTCH